MLGFEVALVEQGLSLVNLSMRAVEEQQVAVIYEVALVAFRVIRVQVLPAFDGERVGDEELHRVLGCLEALEDASDTLVVDERVGLFDSCHPWTFEILLIEGFDRRWLRAFSLPD